MTIELTTEEFESLLMALGIAAGVAHSHGDLKRFYRLIALANAVGKTNPKFTPYEIPPEFQGGAV